MDARKVIKEEIAAMPSTEQADRYMAKLKARQSLEERLEDWLRDANHSRTHLDHAYLFIWQRLNAAEEAIWKLYMTDRVRFFLETITHLRVIYDTHLQFLYMLLNPPLAEDYLDYSTVEIHKLFSVLDTSVSNAFRSSPEYVQQAAKLQNRYDSVKSRFLTKKQHPTVRNHWYVGNLDGLAKAVGYEYEYRVMHRMMSAAVHSAFWPLLNMMPFRTFQVQEQANKLSTRVSYGMAETSGFTLTPEEQADLAEARQPIFKVI